MTDITPSRRKRRPPGAKKNGRARAAKPGIPVENRDELVACMELLFFAYRDFTGDPDSVLEQYGFGRAHHRVVHFVHRNPGLSVADLLLILKITKQSLARVLKQLIEKGYIAQKTGKNDKRQRLLFVTQKGARLAEKLADLQIQRIAEALGEAGPGAEETARKFLFAMIGASDRERVQELIETRQPNGKQPAQPASRGTSK